MSQIQLNQILGPPLTIHSDVVPLARLSFGLSGEDRLLAYMFKKRIQDNVPGIYVDIGCGKPVMASNTYLFYCYGWRGVCIDVQSREAPKWAQYRPDDIYVNAAVSDNAGDVHVFNHPDNWGQTCIRPEPDPPGAGFKLAATMQTTPLSAILAGKFKTGTSIDFFSIDVEGAELGVLRSNDWTQWRPSVIMMECFGYAPNADYPAAVRYLCDRGYIVHGNIGANVVLIRPDR